MTRLARLTLLCLWVTATGCERFDTVENAYPDFAAASGADAVGEGRWIPALLPRSATDIQEAHNIETNEIWLRFRFAAEDLSSMVAACSPSLAEQLSRARKPLVAWWPETLTEDGPRTGKALGDLMFYVCADGSIAVDRDRSEAFFWSTP